MPLTKKGEKILTAMKAQYGAKKGEEVFYASKNAGEIEGVDANEEEDCGMVKSRSKRVTQRDPLGREKSTFEEDAIFQTLEQFVDSQPCYITSNKYGILKGSGAHPLVTPDFADSSPTSVVMYEKIKLDDTAPVRYTPDGYLVAQPRVARTGIQIYAGSECGKADVDTVRVYRPADSVFAQDAMRSFAHRPITLNHPPVPITADNWKEYAIGQIGDEVLKDGEFVRVPMVLMDAAAVREVKNGVDQLSMGYTCDLTWEEGKTPEGETYDAIQRNIRGNHLALVATARGGEKLRLGDIVNERKIIMAENTLRTVVIDGIHVEMSDTAAQVVSRTLKRLQDQFEEEKEEKEKNKEESKKDRASKDEAVSAAKSECEKKDAMIATLQSQLKDAEMTPQKLDALVKDRGETIQKASLALNDKHVSFEGKTVNEIRRQVVDTRLGAQAKSWTDEQVLASFNTLTASPPSKTGGGYSDAVSALSRPGFVTNDDAREAAYAAYDADLQNAYKGKQ